MLYRLDNAEHGNTALPLTAAMAPWSRSCKNNLVRKAGFPYMVFARDISSQLGALRNVPPKELFALHGPFWRSGSITAALMHRPHQHMGSQLHIWFQLPSSRRRINQSSHVGLLHMTQRSWRVLGTKLLH